MGRSEICPTMGNGGNFSMEKISVVPWWKVTAQIFLHAYKTDQVLAEMADNSQVSALLVAGVKDPWG